MKSASWIEPTDWMRAAPTRRVVDALRADGQEIRFVGGCVRDALLAQGVLVGTCWDPQIVRLSPPLVIPPLHAERLIDALSNLEVSA